MPSFDVVSEVDLHELSNAVNQAQREIDNRFDFKGVAASFELADGKISLKAPSEFQVQQMRDILENKVVKRGMDVLSLDFAELSSNVSQATQEVTVKQGIDKEAAKKIVKEIKNAKLKVQAAIQGEQVRVTGKKRDDLQDTMAMLRESSLGLPLQYTNFRD